MFLTDKAGHARDMTWARMELLRVDRLLSALADESKDTLIVVTSDHGNVEDLSTGSHTRAEVPLLACGPSDKREAADAFLRDAKSLRDLAPRLLGGS
jgi:phosphopentomutase